VGGCGTWLKGDVEGLEGRTHGERAPHHQNFSLSKVFS
jgi:hypothetical protein